MAEPPAGSAPDYGRDTQRAIYLGGVSGTRPEVSTDLTTLEARARRRLSQSAFGYLAGGAGTGSTMRGNRAAFERWRIVPRMLCDVEHRDTTVSLLGHVLPAPLLLAPIGVLELARRDGDLAVARAAATERIPMIFSNQASVSMEACSRVMGNAVRWFQLYWSRSDALVESFVARAEACGCTAIVLTLDTTMLGWRTRDLDHGFLPFLHGQGLAQYVTDPVFRRELADLSPDAGARPRITPATLRVAVRQLRHYPGSWREKRRYARVAVQHFARTYSRPSLTWDLVTRLRAMTSLPVVLKGILHPDDARRAVEDGVDAIVVSNHGGRQVDGAIAALDALPPVVDAVQGRVPVLLDSGVRSGADVFRAVALGATAVLLGRPYAYGLALAGEPGVREVLRNVRADFDLTMGLAGCRSVAEVGDGGRVVQLTHPTISR